MSTATGTGGMVNASMQVLTKPSEASFQAVKGSVKTSWTVIALLVAGAISGLLGKLLSGDVGAMVTGLIGGAIGGLIGYYIGQVILWIFAKIFGGKGGLGFQANLLALFYAPLTVVNSILALIPVVGLILTLIVGIYELVLLTFGLKVTHEYSTGKAVLTWLVPAIIVAIIAAILFVIVGAAIFAAISGGLGQ